MSPSEKNDICEIRETLQELIVLVARQGECQKNFVESQNRSNQDIKDMLKSQKEDIKSEINTLRKDHCERLNKHSEKIESNGKDISAMKAVNGFISASITIGLNGAILIFKNFMK